MPSTEYDAVHARVRRSRGRAAEHRCCVPGCERQAGVWAWQRTGPSRTGFHHGKELSWGTSEADYAPMCLSHAGQMDRGGSVTHCPHGHERAVHGSAPDGQCRECKRVEAKSEKRLARLRLRYAEKKAAEVPPPPKP